MFDKNSIGLVVIDMQNGVFNKKTKIYKENELIENINLLIDVFHDKALPVYFIRHTNKSMLVKDSFDWQIHPELHLLDNDVVVNKETSSVFKEKTLKNELDRAGVSHIIVTGLVSNGCVKAACEDGKKLGLDVTLASDAHSSFNKDAENLVKEWNEILAAEGVNLLETYGILESVKCL